MCLMLVLVECCFRENKTSSFGKLTSTFFVVKYSSQSTAITHVYNPILGDDLTVYVVT